MHCAVATALACTAHVEDRPDSAPPDDAAGDVAVIDGSLDASQDVAQDAAQDASSDVVVYDAPPDCGDGSFPVQCGPPGAPCAGWVCGFDCPSGCEPYV